MQTITVQAEYISSIGSIVVSSADVIITGETTATKLGNQVVLGDINGDGYADLVAGAYEYNNMQGRVYIFHGSAGGLTSGIINAGLTPDAIITGGGADYKFGYSLCNMQKINVITINLTYYYFQK